MNTSGMIRSYQSRGKNIEEFLKVVVQAIALEFDREVVLKSIDNGFIISMKDYKIKISEKLAEELKTEFPQ